jgi:hypothetical protein
MTNFDFDEIDIGQQWRTAKNSALPQNRDRVGIAFEFRVDVPVFIGGDVELGATDRERRLSSGRELARVPAPLSEKRRCGNGLGRSKRTSDIMKLC